VFSGDLLNLANLFRIWNSSGPDDYAPAAMGRTKANSNAGDCRYRLVAMMARKGA